MGGKRDLNPGCRDAYQFLALALLLLWPQELLHVMLDGVPFGHLPMVGGDACSNVTDS